MDERADLCRDGAIAVSGGSVGIQTVECEAHVEGPVVDIGQRGVLVAHEPVEGAAAQAKQAEALDSGARFDGLYG